MSYELLVLCLSAAAIGFVHTIIGPDHYLPFVMLARARKWSLAKTGWITFICGLGHVASSVLIGIAGIAFGIALTRVADLDSIRGNLAAWFLIVFGFTFFIWGVHRAIRNRPHRHHHVHGDEEGSHVHEHSHTMKHAHIHADAGKKSITPWVLFIIFVFGPCEPLIPLLMYPAATIGIGGVALVTLIFSIATIGTMLAAVVVLTLGYNMVNLGRLERYSEAIAGFTILFSGIAIKFLGL